MWIKKSKPLRPKYAYLKSDPEILFKVFEIYTNQVGVWHDPQRAQELPVVFYRLDEVELIWDLVPRDNTRHI